MSLQPIDPQSVTYQGRDFTEAEAVAITHSIKAYAKQTCFKLADAHDGRAYLAMGYDTFEAYCATELDISRSRGYQLLRHAAAMREIGEAAGIDPVSTNVDTTEGQTRAIDTTAVAAKVAERVAAEPEADEGRRAEIVDEVIEEHKVVTKRTTSVDPETGEILNEGPSSDAPVPPGAVEPDDDAAPNVEGSATPGEGAAPEGSDGSPTADPSDDRKPAPPSPALQRAKLAEQASKAAHAVRSKLLPLDPADIAAVCPADEWDAFQSLAVDLRRWCDQVDAAFSPNLRSVQ